MISSFTEIKFWNKNSSTNEFLITAPSCLDNYFRSQSSRLKCGHMSNQMQFNSLPDHQSIEKILSKRIQGVRQCPSSQSMLKQEIKFINKATNLPTYKKLEQIFDFYLQYKSNSKQLNKALNSGKINQQIIKPFVKMYSAMRDNQYRITQTSKQEKTKKQFNKLFEEILKQDKNNVEILVSDDQILENYFQDTRLKLKPNILEQANKIEKTIQNSKKDTEQPKPQHEKIRFELCNKYIPIAEQQKQSQMNVPTSRKVPLTTTKVSVKKLKFKQLTQFNDDSELCRELDLLISDTNKILKPNQDS